MIQDHCACPGPSAIAPQGCCPRCGATGSRRAAALAAALAAGNWRPAIADARQAGWVLGYLAGIAAGRRQVIDALTAPPRPLPPPRLIGTTPPAEPEQGAAA